MGDPNRRMFSPEIEAMPREDIERLQEEKLLGDLVPWAYERSGLIRETWDADEAVMLFLDGTMAKAAARAYELLALDTLRPALPGLF